MKLAAFIKPDHGRWDSFPSIGDMWGKKIIFIKKKVTQHFYTPFLFIKYSKTTHWKHYIHVIIQNVKKRSIFSIEKNYGAFNRGTLIRFLRNFLHLKKNIIVFTIFNFFLSLKYKYTIMCNYLNKNTKWCSLHSVYIFMKFVQKMYSLFVWYIFKTVQQ